MRTVLLISAILFSHVRFDYITTVKIDSLKPLVKYSISGVLRNDTININRLNKLAVTFFKSNPDSTLFYGQLAQKLSVKSNYLLGLANALVQTGHVHYVKGDLISARNEFDHAIKIFRQFNCKKGLGVCYELYGDMLNLQADYKQSLYYLNLALQLNHQLNNRAGIASCDKNIGMVNFGQGRFSVTLDYYYKALNIDLKDNNKSEAAEIYNNIGDVLQGMEAYSKALEFYKKGLSEAKDAKDMLQTGIATQDIGEVFLGEKKYDNALKYLTNSLKIANKLSNQDGISYVDADIALCYAGQGQFSQSLKLLDTALIIAVANKMAYDEAYATIALATVNNLQGNYLKAYKLAIKGQALGHTLDNVWFRANAVMELYKSSAGMHKYQDAFKFSLLYNSLRDSIKSDESIQKITSNTLSLIFAAKQQQIEEHHREQVFLYNEKIKQQRIFAMYSIIMIVVVLVGLFYYRQRRRQLKTIAALGYKNAEILRQKHDIEEQAAKLNDSNILKNSLIAILAHDLRAPLCTLRAIFDLLIDQTISIRDALSMVPSVVKKLDYTSDFLDTLLYWINSQVENFGASAKGFCLNSLVQLQIDKFGDLIKEKELSITKNINDDVYLLADQNSIRIVLHNLIINSIKFSKPNGTIHISSNQHEFNPNYQVVSVLDTGIGISDVQLKKLFKEKVSSELGTNNESGTGMGLMFCRDLIAKSGGEIWATSELHKGTKFSFTIPLVINLSPVNVEAVHEHDPCDVEIPHFDNVILAAN